MSQRDAEHAQSVELQEALEERISEARESLATAGESVVAFIKDKPVVCILGALAAGYLVGRVLRR